MYPFLFIVDCADCPSRFSDVFWFTVVAVYAVTSRAYHSADLFMLFGQSGEEGCLFLACIFLTSPFFHLFISIRMLWCIAASK
ncbi:unnamed protein product [Protopolystoma xenopodis]|uniref:Uncharacterized protein n=1 Tax=Protopolystoma xenopodis TaxID=117903 RepID=A0A3S5BVW3_9PLAT|nr:unnamed protein product [Protopolystoma xenopodis]